MFYFFEILTGIVIKYSKFSKSTISQKKRLQMSQKAQFHAIKFRKFAYLLRRHSFMKEEEYTSRPYTAAKPKKYRSCSCNYNEKRGQLFYASDLKLQNLPHD